MGWDQTKWPEAKFPTAVSSRLCSFFVQQLIPNLKADLDSDPLLKGRLISLSRVDGHARWVSGAVLDLMHNLPEKVDGGLILRDDADGKPTGKF